MATACWADLHGDLLVSIAAAAGKGSSLKCYVCLRGVCKAWRSALASPYPYLLSLADERVSVLSLPKRGLSSTVAYSTIDDDERRWTRTPRTARLVGSGKGRLAITLGRWICSGYQTEKIFLVEPSTGEEVKILPRLTVNKERYPTVHKIVFAPGPNDGMIVAIYDQKRVSYIDTSSSSRDDMKWTAVDFRPQYYEHLVDLVFDDAGGGKVYFLDSRGGVRVLRIPRGVGNEPWGVGIEPLQAIVSLPGDAVSAPPYDMASAKNLFFCHGSLYQVWQNTSVAVSSRDGSTMSANEIFVMRCNGQWPYCWDKVKDGGCSVFVARNNSPVVARAGALPDVKADSVYWIDWRGVPMVCDLATGTSKRCFLPYGVGVDSCWFF